jgi:hypothetical protein
MKRSTVESLARQYRLQIREMASADHHHIFLWTVVSHFVAGFAQGAADVSLRSFIEGRDFCASANMDTNDVRWTLAVFFTIDASIRHPSPRGRLR